MAFRKRRVKSVGASILSGSACIRPGSVYDATSIRIAEDLGFELGMFGGSVASLVVLGDPDITLDHADRTCRADAADVARGSPAGGGRCRPRLWQRANVRRTVQELETAGAAGLTIEETPPPQAFGLSRDPS